MPNDDLLKDLIRNQVDTINIHKKATTHCFSLSHEVFKKDTPNFERIESHYSLDGLIVKYKCNIDNRIYNVHITPVGD
jgi:hypothetical protein